jgi:hypothetical protein
MENKLVSSRFKPTGKAVTHPRGRLGDPRASFMERIASRLFVREEVPSRSQADRLYLRRFRILVTPWFRLYLHVFYLSDDDPDPHGHPWPFVTFVMRGGYRDETWWVTDGGMRGVYSRSPVLRAGSIAVRGVDHIHRVRLLDPGRRTWTLVVTGRRQREWFFYTENGPILGDEYGRTETRT